MIHRIGRYRLIKRIATGGMAEIHLAKLLGEAGFEKEIVIKRILPQWTADDEFIRMLIDEAKIAVQLSHPNIVGVYELARDGEIYYIAMEYLHGVDLRRLMQKAAGKGIPWEVALTVIADVLEGLAYAHTKRDTSGRHLKIVHRDISPQNILVSFDGSVKIADFGIAKAASRSHETIAGVLKGKFAYMSPEQANHEPLDGRSDLFSTAVVLYELLTGNRLFYRSSDQETLHQVRQCRVLFEEKAQKKIPPRLQEIVLKGLAKDPADRYPDASLFRDDLLKFARRSRKAFKRETLVSFLEKLFREEISRPTPEEIVESQPTSPLVEETRTAADQEVFASTKILTEKPTQRAIGNLSRPLATTSRALQVALVFGFAVMATILLVLVNPHHPVDRSETGVRPEDQKRFTPPEIARPDKQTSPELTAPVPSEPEVLPPVASLKGGVLPKVDAHSKTGYLSVQAIPWGIVFVDGGRRGETPLRRLSLKAGDHTLRVVHEPSGAAASTKFLLAAGGDLVCLAHLQRTQEIRCGE